MKQGLMAATVLVTLLIALAGIPTNPAHAAGYIVDSSVDDLWAHDSSPGDYVCENIWGECTLRAALEEANAQGGPHTITFNQGMTIYVDANVGGLPSLDEQIRLDASAVWDNGNDEPGVMIHGGGASFVGLMLKAVGCEIYGLYITAFNGAGVYVTSSHNTIGGAGPGQRNVLSGNISGITMTGSTANNNVVQNNYVGLTAWGTTTNPNRTGVVLTSGANNNIIGGSGAGQSNFIGGNTQNGVTIEGSGTDSNLVSSNGIGLGADLATSLPNGQAGVLIQDGPNNTFIGGASNAGNFITYNGQVGVHISKGGRDTNVGWNIIGSNNSDGVAIYDTTSCWINNNTIASNRLAGVRVNGAPAAGNLIWPNSITDNGFKGIWLQNGGNSGIARPTITGASQWAASGTTCASCQVALYSDADDEGQVYHDIVLADPSGHWSYAGGPLVGPNLTATAIDISGNTSEFSAAVAVGGGTKYWVYVPLNSRNR